MFLTFKEWQGFLSVSFQRMNDSLFSLRNHIIRNKKSQNLKHLCKSPLHILGTFLNVYLEQMLSLHTELNWICEISSVTYLSELAGLQQASSTLSYQSKYRDVASFIHVNQSEESADLGRGCQMSSHVKRDHTWVKWL